jgi:hypothetical protein
MTGRHGIVTSQMDMGSVEEKHTLADVALRYYFVEIGRCRRPGLYRSALWWDGGKCLV